jgi:GcrA cell cycle regulator
MSWTDERVQQLKKLWSDGLSASQIAAELGGVTRNAVIGKVHRLGLSGRAKTSNQSPSRVKRHARSGGYTVRGARKAQRALVNTGMKINGYAPSTALIDDIDLVAPEPLKLSLVQLNERTCKWPIGDPASEEFHFCGHDADDSGPYCSYHARLAYQPVADRRRERKVIASA